MSAAVFNIAKAKDKHGNEIEPVHDYVPGVIRYHTEGFFGKSY